MIKPGTKFTIQYLFNNFIQDKYFLTEQEENEIRKNAIELKNIASKEERDIFQKKNKCKSDQNDVWSTEDFGKLCLNKTIGDICDVIEYTESQKAYKFKILKIN